MLGACAIGCFRGSIKSVTFVVSRMEMLWYRNAEERVYERLTSRWRRPGMRSDLHEVERGGAAEIPSQGEGPGASARGC